MNLQELAEKLKGAWRQYVVVVFLLVIILLMQVGRAEVETMLTLVYLWGCCVILSSATLILYTRYDFTPKEAVLIYLANSILIGGVILGVYLIKS